LLHNEFEKPLEQIQEELHRNNHWTGEIVQTKRNGQRITVLSRWALDRDEDGNPAGVLAVNTDITERKRVEQELRDAGERKNEFLAMLAHELRNPIAPIRYMLEIMKSADNNAELMEHARSTMERQLVQMTRLIDDLLDVSRISRGKLNLRMEQVELVSVLRHVVEACRPVMGNHKLTVALPPHGLYLNADPVRLAQVFGNLLSNAVKFTEPGGRVALTAEQQGSDAVVSVKDTGVGISHNMLPKVFEMFTQANQELERTQGGLGIGLTLVERLVEMHGGSVKAFSEGPGHGSEFVVRLPGLIEKPKPQPPEPTASEQTGAARRILVVDDNRDSAESLALLLRLSGHETHMAHDGLEAVETAATFKPDVVLLDIGLPKLNGYDVCRRIRQQPGGNGIVLIALTGWGQDEDRRKSQEAGFNGHLVKPVDHSSLTKLLTEFAPRD
jgi:signal transduction histidine kinase/ActR/RegA family two-component response regulator